MSQIVSRAWRPTSTRPRPVTTQRRFKTFQRRVDKNNEYYYTISKKRPVTDPEAPPESQQFFEMPNLLLDLDAEGSQNVREFDDKDEELMEAKWRVNPKRAEVRLKLNDLEGELNELRRKAQDIVASPSNIWRLTSYDLLSAALQGSPGKAHIEASQEPACLDTLEGSHLINALRRENGIPSHVSASDVLLLEWMLLRRHSTDSARTANNEEPLKSNELVEALRSQSSIVGIRRLLLHQLRSWATLKSHFRPSSSKEGAAADVAGQIRKSCIDILASSETRPGQLFSCLALLGSLVERLSKASLDHDSRLHGLALRAAAQSGSLVALSEWIHRTHSSGSWKNGPEILEDVAACIDSCSKQLATDFVNVADRQLLLQLLTGLNEHETLNPESLRSIAFTNLENRRDIKPAVASKVCEAYATLLGKLGAVRTLLKESESPNTAVKTACTAVLKNTPRYSETLKTQGVKTMSLEECVSLDYHDIEETA